MHGDTGGLLVLGSVHGLASFNLLPEFVVAWMRKRADTSSTTSSAADL